MIDRKRLVKTFCDLVQIDSPSGEEAAITAELTKRLEGLGFTTELDDYGNLIARKGEGENPLLLSAHMDTVEPGRGVKTELSKGRPDRVRRHHHPGRRLQVPACQRPFWRRSSP